MSGNKSTSALEFSVRKTLTEQSMLLFGTDCNVKDIVDDDGRGVLIRLSGVVSAHDPKYVLTEDKMSLMRRAFEGFEVFIEPRDFRTDTGEKRWALQPTLLYRPRSRMSGWDAFRRRTPASEIAVLTISALSLLILLVVTWHYLQANKNPWT